MVGMGGHGRPVWTLPGGVVEGTPGAAAVAAFQRALFDSTFDAMLLANDSRSYVDCNPAACLLFGASREEMLGRNMCELTGTPLGVSSAWHQFLNDGRAEGQFRLLRLDGEARDVDYRATANVAPNRHLLVLRDMTESTENQRAQESAPAERRLEESRARRVEEQPSQAQEMAAVGAQAGGMAHDFNNLFSIILTYTLLVTEQLKPDDPLQRDLDEVRRAAERATELTRGLLALGQQLR